MSRKVIAIGHIPARGKIIKRTFVGWCRVCEADRILVGVVAWADRPLRTGQCLSCRNTVSVNSARPSDDGSAA